MIPDSTSTVRQRINYLVDRLAEGNASGFARKVGVTRSALEKWLKSAAEPSRSSLVKLSHGANVCLRWLATGEGPLWLDDELPAEKDPLLAEKQADRLSYLVELFGVDVAALASRCGLSRQILDAIHDQTLVPTSDQIARLLKGTGASRTWLETGRGEILPASRPSVPPSSGVLISENTREPPAPPDRTMKVRPTGLIKDGFGCQDACQVLLYNSLADWGVGQVDPNAVAPFPMVVPRRLIASDLGGVCGSVIAVYAIGDSMAPSIRAQEMVFLDTSSTTVGGDDVFAFTFEGNDYINRLQRIGVGVRVHYDNPNYDDWTIEAAALPGLKVVGRIIGSTRAIP